MNGDQGKLGLKWNDFQENAISAFGMLMGDKELADVTLACEDGQQVKAHRVILASSSPFFMNLLRRNKHPHPLIYMRGLKTDDLVAMVDFLYYREVNIFQENLDPFLALAEELQLKGFTDSNSVKTLEDHTKHSVTEKISSRQMHSVFALAEELQRKKLMDIGAEKESEDNPKHPVAKL